MQRIQGLPGPREVRSLAGRREAGLGLGAGPECCLRCFATLVAGQEGAGSFLCPTVFSQMFVCNTSYGYLGTHVMGAHTDT